MDKLTIIAPILLLAVILTVGYFHNPNEKLGSAVSPSALFTLATTSGPAAFIVTSTGKVGIGTSNPLATLEVAGPIRLTKKSAGCDQNAEGEIAYNPDNKRFWGCDGVAWHQLDN
jgi:hypothetical protein